METYYIRSRPDFSTLVTWAGGAMPSKYADARAIRAKHRYAKRRSKR